MGQKVHPTGFRLGITKPWESRWYARKEYSQLLHEDLYYRKEIKRRFYHAGVARVEIERAANRAKITIYTARPGIIIGRKGSEIERLKQENLLPDDVTVGVVEIAKRTAVGLRLMGQHPRDGRTQAPRIGQWCIINDREGIVATTGYPFRFPGTPQPLHVRVVEGELDIESVLYDTFAMAQLAWASPEASMRLPIDLKLIDDYLRSLAGAADDEAALYGEVEAAVGSSHE